MLDVLLHRQSPDIAAGVNTPLEERNGQSLGTQLGAGDQGVMVGYACSETPEKMPLAVMLAHRITRRLADVRKAGETEGLLPDGKAQVTVEYGDGQPVRLDTVVLSAQHRDDVRPAELEQALREKVLIPALRALPPDEDTRILINPSGRFVLGGPDADTGLTGRKLMVDSYGPFVPHGGGAFSGKDATKVDRGGAYMARYIAKNIVAAQLAPIPDLPDRKTICIMERGNEKCQPKAESPGRAVSAHRPARRPGGRCAAAQKPFAVGQGKTV